MNKLWMRLGVTISATDAEIEKLLAKKPDEWDAEESKKVLLKILNQNRFRIDGNTYIPSPVIERYNEENGTCFNSGVEPEWDM